MRDNAEKYILTQILFIVTFCDFSEGKIKIFLPCRVYIRAQYLQKGFVPLSARSAEKIWGSQIITSKRCKNREGEGGDSPPLLLAPPKGRRGEGGGRLPSPPPSPPPPKGGGERGEGKTPPSSWSFSTLNRIPGHRWRTESPSLEPVRPNG